MKTLKDIYQYRELLLSTALRSLKIRFARTLLGLLWIILQPLLYLAIFILLFQQFLKIETGAVPYPLFALTGMAAWNFFSFQVLHGSAALIEFQSIITKIYFPKIILHLSKTIIATVDFIILLFFCFILMVWYDAPLSIRLIFLPLFFTIGIFTALTISLTVSILTVRFRDLQLMLQYFLNLFLWITPVAYPSTIIPENWQWLYFCNPVAGFVDGIRWCILGMETEWIYFIPSFMITFLLFLGSFYYFRKNEIEITDYI